MKKSLVTQSALNSIELFLSSVQGIYDKLLINFWKHSCSVILQGRSKIDVMENGLHVLEKMHMLVLKHIFSILQVHRLLNITRTTCMKKSLITVLCLEFNVTFSSSSFHNRTTVSQRAFFTTLILLLACTAGLTTLSKIW